MLYTRPAVEFCLGVSPAGWCRSFFLLASAAVLAVAALPREARQLLVDYGARQQHTTSSSPPSDDSNNNKHTKTGGRDDDGIMKVKAILATVTSWGQVPHSWFIAFYLVSLFCSVFWAGQYLYDGQILRMLASSNKATREGGGESMTFSQVVLVWSLMVLQATRRIYEHIWVMKPSKAKMWVVHWLLGLGFYLAVSVSVWVQGSEAILQKLDGQRQQVDAGVPMLRTDAGVPMLRTALAVPLFFWAWTNQHKCHRQLAGLKKYSIPKGGMFDSIVCPHYTCECLIYLSLAILAAPPGRNNGSFLNQTLLCAVIFVVVNLGVTAYETRRWYEEKFGPAAIQGKWNMIPFLF